MLLLLICVVNGLQFSKEVAEKLFTKGGQALILFYDENSHQSQVQEFMETSKQHLNLLFIEANSNDISVQQLMKFILIPQLPAIKIIQCDGPLQSEIKQISYNDQIQEEMLNKFINRFLSGNLYQDIISQDIPSKSQEEGIQMLVGHNFEEQVKDSSTDYLVLFYSKACDLCDSMLLNLIQLNNQIKSGKTSIKPYQLKCGKIDGDSNQITGLNVDRYPSIFLYTKNRKDRPLLYTGDRTSEGMLMWIEHHKE